jgi:enoyl-CoA hydratase/carnithine racemase
MSNAVIIGEADRKVIILFNRPEIRSPLSISVLETMAVIVDHIEGRDDIIDRMIFTGVGSVFASGADLREIAEVDAENAREFALRGQNLIKRISEIDETTIAAVNGICFGGALDLALACDRRIASPDAMFSHPGADLGIMTGWGGTLRLSRLVGEAVSLEMFFTAKRVNSSEALLIGLIDEVVDDPLAHALS